jgi:hypothetical protein
MRTKLAACVLIAVAALALSRSSHGQVQGVPGPGSGIVSVVGKVDIGNVPQVEAAQRGNWSVSLAHVPDVRVTNAPNVSIAAPTFVKAGSRYEIIWAPNEREVVRLAQVASSGWARVESTGRPRWVNLSLARSVEELQ